MKAFYSVNLDEFSENLKQIENDSTANSVLILMADDQHFISELVDPILQSFSKPIVGGVFSEIIVDCKVKTTGVLLLPLAYNLKSKVFHFENEDSYLSMLKNNFSTDLPDRGSLFIFTDAFVIGKNTFLESLFNFFGNDFAFIGGGCGTTSLKSSKCIVHNSGIHSNAAIVGLSEEIFSIGVAHGWTPIAKPMKATEVEFNIVKSINWEPAFKVYKAEVEAHSELVMDETNFQEIAKSYPIGLIKIDGMSVIRDPFLLTNNTIHFLDSIDKGQYFSIMHGNTQSLLDAAKQAKAECMSTFNEADNNTGYVLCINCFSRAKFLDTVFEDELKIISGNQHLYGALTFGEIANVGDLFLEIYNKTVIVAKWK